jgi:hypothetical protein
MEIYTIPQLRDPIMVCAFTGWSDAGEASTSLISHLLKVLSPDAGGNEAESGYSDRLTFHNTEFTTNFPELMIAQSQSEDFYDYQVTRPTISLNLDSSRQLTWPGTRIYGVANPRGERDFILVEGVEPSMRWRSFAAELLDLADDCEVSLVIAVGAMLADTPHTRPIPVSTTAASPEIAAQRGLEVSRYEGPTGVLAVIQDEAVRREIEAVAIWAAVPHYASALTAHKATLALLNGLEDTLNLSLVQGELPEASLLWERAVTQMVSEDSDIEEYIKALEASQDSNIADESGEELAREVERFLRRENAKEDGLES